MAIAAYSEDTLVQQTTVEYLEERLGWESVYSHNHEDFGPDSLLGRASDREVVLTRPLRTTLAALNPGLPDAAHDHAVRQIAATAASQNIAAANREKHALIRDGVQVTFRNDKGERVRNRLRVFDFDEPANNHFLCLRELWVRGDLYRRRADIVGFVNGLPLLFIECKNIHRDLRAAFERNYSDYREKDRVTIEQTYEALLKLVQELDEEESRALREGLDEESLAIFDLLKKPDLGGTEIRRIKRVAVELLRTLKAEKLRVDQWREKESTRDAVHITIRDFLWSDETGLPADGYSEGEVEAISDHVFQHVFRVYPTVPSPYYEGAEAA